jgi:hypothetical protein
MSQRTYLKKFSQPHNYSNMKDLFQSIRDAATAVGDLYTKPRDLAAIWLERPVFTSAGRTVRIAPGAEIAIDKDGNIIADADKATHRVCGCHGTLVDQFEFTVVNIETLEPSIIKV